MGTGASVPMESPAKSQARSSDLNDLSSGNNKAIISTSKTVSTSLPQEEDKSLRNSSTPFIMDQVINDEAQEKPISNNKLKKMALGIQGYKDKDRDYDQTLAQMDFNKGQKVEWSEPKSPEKQLITKSSKDNIAWEIKQESSSPSLRPYSNSRSHAVGKTDDANRGIDFSPMSSLQLKSSASNVLTPAITSKPAITSPPVGTFCGPPPGIVVRPFPGNISGKALPVSSEFGVTTPVKTNLLTSGSISSPPSQHYLLTPVPGPGNLPMRPFNGMNQLSPAVTGVNTPNNKGITGGTPMMMAIPPSAVRGSATVPVPFGGVGGGLVPIMGAPPQLIIGPNGIPVGAVPVAAIPMGTMPVSVSSSVSNNVQGGSLQAVMIPASPAGVLNGNIPIGAPRGLPVTTAPLPVVKETKDVKRNKAQLPSNLTHAKPTTGDWLNKRYIVNNYILLDILGTGSYGEVRLCKDRTSERLYAIKIISKDFLKKRKNGKTTETYFEDIKREIAIMKKLLHPNILRLFEVLDDPKVNKMYLVLEYMKKGDLINVLKKRDGSGDGEFQPLSDAEVWQIFRQLVAGIRYLHFQNIVHGDIKPQNLLLGDDGIVKIADFGISQMLSGSDEQLHDAGGTPAFMAPELCEGKRNFSGQLADIWAMGATIYMLRFGHPPFVAKSIINLYYKICNDPLVFPTGVLIDPGLQNLIEGMLEKDPEKRLTIPNIVMHPWYRHPPAPPAMVSSSSESNRDSKPIGPSASPLVGAKSSQPPSRPTTSNSTPIKSQPPTISVSSDVPQSFQPPPSYDAEADEAMKGPIHRTVLHNEEVFMSIGNISNSGQDQEDYESAIGEVIEEGDDESDDEIDEDKKKNTMKASDKLLGLNREATSTVGKQESIEENDEVGNMSSKIEAVTSNIMTTGDSDIMGTNWGAGVFQMVDDDDDKIDDDDDIDDADIDDSEAQDRFDNNNSNSKQRSTSTGIEYISRKESHNEMSEEEEARRSRRFIKKITKKSTENMMRSLPKDNNNESGNIAVNGSRGNQSHDLKDASQAKQGGNKKINGLSSSSSAVSVGSATNTTSLSKSQSQPIDGNVVSANSSNISIQNSNPSSSASLSAASSPYLKPGTRSVRGDPTRTFSTNSAFDDDEPEALTTEEFQAMMDTLSQHNSQTGCRCVIPDEVETNASNIAENSSLGSAEIRLVTEKSLALSRSSNSGANTITSTVRSLRQQSCTDQALCTTAMSVVWDQLELLRAAYVNLKLKVGGSFHSEQGIRPTQEDRCVLLPNVAAMQSLEAYDLNPGTKEQLSMFSLAAIFDGHDGWRSSQYLSQYLATMLVTHDKFLDPKQLNNAINDTFTNIDIQLCDLLREEEDNSGSTGVVAIYDGRKKTLTVAGVGDSICVLCRNGHAIEMNKMHRITDNAAERERVKNAGGKIINQRVNGVLAVSRSFGDTPFKTLHELQSNNSVNPSFTVSSSSLRPPTKSHNIKAKLPLIRLVNESLVTAVPEIYTEIITPQTEFALVASDGLWDTMTPQLAVSYVRQHLSREKDLNKVAQAIVREALDRGSIDNITVLILSFNATVEQG